MITRNISCTSLCWLAWLLLCWQEMRMSTSRKHDRRVRRKIQVEFESWSSCRGVAVVD